MIDLTSLVVKIANQTTPETPFLISQIEKYIKDVENVSGGVSVKDPPCGMAGPG